MPEQFLSPIGRFVQGDAFVPQLTNQQGQPRVFQSGAKVGQPNPQFFMAVAFRKDDPAFPAFYAILDRVARTEWPTLFPVPGGPCVNPQFSFKVIDGDGMDTTGKRNAEKEGFAGHWVVRFASGFAPKCFHVGHYQPQDQIRDPMMLRRGYHVRISGSVEGNKNPTKPGIYVNLGMVELAGGGVEITSGPDAATVFAATAGQQLPPGATMAPVPTLPTPGAPLPLPPGPVTPYTPPPAPGAPAPGYPPQPAPVYPNPAIYPGLPPQPLAPPPAPPPAPPAPPPAPPPVPQRVMLPAAQGATYESMIANGWTDAVLIQHGMMAP